MGDIGSRVNVSAFGEERREFELLISPNEQHPGRKFRRRIQSGMRESNPPNFCRNAERGIGTGQPKRNVAANAAGFAPR